MIQLRNERDLPKLIGNGNNLKELLNVPRLGNTYTARIAEMGKQVSGLRCYNKLKSSRFEPYWVLAQVEGCNLVTRLPLIFESKIDSKTQ